MKKKIISLLLCAAIALSLVPPLTASAEVMTSEISVTLELGKKIHRWHHRNDKPI